MSERKQFGMLPASGLEIELGDEVFASMDGADANLYYENNGTPVFAGRIAGVIETLHVRRLCSENGRPLFRVTSLPKASTLHTIEVV